MSYSIGPDGEELKYDPEAFLRQRDFIEESLEAAVQPWEPLQERGLEGLGKWLLEIAYGVNNSILNTGYNQWERVLAYRILDSQHYQGVEFRTHGDWGSKTGGTSYLHKYVQVVRFKGDDGLRVRYITERHTLDDYKPPYLVGMYDQDFTKEERYRDSMDKTVAFEITAHMLAGSFLFTDAEPSHPTVPPLSKGFRYQTWTTVIPAQIQPVTD